MIMSEYAYKLDGNDGPFTIADFGTADGKGFIQIIPDLIGKKVSIYMYSSYHVCYVRGSNLPSSSSNIR